MCRSWRSSGPALPRWAGTARATRRWCWSSRRSVGSPRSTGANSSSRAASSIRFRDRVPREPGELPNGDHASLLARYTTGTTVGLKAFYRQQIAAALVGAQPQHRGDQRRDLRQALQPVDASLTGRPVGSARFGYELNLPRLNQAARQRPARSAQRSVRSGGAADDVRLRSPDHLRRAEPERRIRRRRRGRRGGRQTDGRGRYYPVASGFYARGFWTQGAYAFAIPRGPVRAIVPYGRYEQRRAGFEGFRPITVARVTAGLRLDLWECLILKAELLVNQELAGAPVVDNNVFTTSAVYSW